MIAVVDDGAPHVSDPVEPASLSPAELEGYLGTYFSEDADYEWVLRITNDRLSLWDQKTWDESALQPVVRGRVSAWGGTYTFFRDSRGRVVGFAVDSEGLRNLKFVRR